MKIHKTLLRVLFFYIAFTAMFVGVFAQSSISSPYSRFGMGELAPQYNLRSSAMGGISQGILNPTMVNFANPASYAAFDSLSFLFDFGITGTFKNLKSEGDKSRHSTASVNHLTIGMPIVKRWRTALGLVPVSSIGYDIHKNVKADEYQIGEEWGGEEWGNVSYRYTGDGAYYKAFWGNSFKISKNIAIGLNAGYMFGNSTYTRMVSFDTLTVRTTKITNQIFANGFIFEPAVQCQMFLSPKEKITIGATYQIQSRIKAENNRMVRTMFGEDGNRPDTITIDIIKGNMTIPTSLKTGLSYELTGKLLVGADFYWTNMSQYGMLGQNDSISNNWGISIGGELVPSVKTSAKYFQKVTYRAGFKTQQSLFNFDGEKINLYAVTFGMGLPIARSKTMINIYVEGGMKGKTSNHLIQENYFKIGAGLSLHEMWFYKRQYR